MSFDMVKLYIVYACHMFFFVFVSASDFL